MDFQSFENSDLKYALLDIKEDYGLNNKRDQFALWVLTSYFGMDIESLEENFLFDAESSNTTFYGITYGAPLKLGIVGIEFVAEDGAANLGEISEKFTSWRQEAEIVGSSLYEVINDVEPVYEVSFFLVSNRKTIDIAIADTISIVDLSVLYNKHKRSKQPQTLEPPPFIELDVNKSYFFLHPHQNEYSSDMPQTLVTTLPLNLLHKWMQQWEDRLFEQNLRFRLADSNTESSILDQQIQDTVKKTPENMLLKNNGITITCTEIVNFSEDDINIRAKLINPQIVNGCQTAWAVHDAVAWLHENSELMEQEEIGYVLTKIVQTTDTKLANEITSSSNKQNAIKARDRLAKDPIQLDISGKLAKWTEDWGIYWDHVDGGWNRLQRISSTSEFKIHARNKYRKIDTQTAGQAMIAMVGEVHRAKQEGGKIFESPDDLYRIAFRFDVPHSTRFNNDQHGLRSFEDYNLDMYVEDMMFAYALNFYARTAFDMQFNEKLKVINEIIENPETTLQNLSVAEQNRQNLTNREFVKFWRLDVVRLVHMLVEKHCEKDDAYRMPIRQNLVGDLRMRKYIDCFFESSAQRKAMFNMESKLSSPAILSLVTPSDHLPLLGLWFKSLESIASRVIGDMMAKQGVSARVLMLNRASTFPLLESAIHKEIESTGLDLLFPME